MVVNYHQQAPPSLTFASPLAKLNSVNGSGVALIFSLVKSTHAFKQEFSYGLKWTDMTFKLTHITFNHGASYPSLESWAIERQNDQVKHYASSSLLNHYFRVFYIFSKIKLRASIVWHSQVSQYMWYLWILTKAIGCYAFLFLQLRLMWSS